MIFNIFLGLGLMGLGLLTLKFWRNVYNFTGALDFVEKWSTAGTPAFIRIVGVILVIFGLGMIFGLWTWITQPFADGVKSLGGSELKR